MDIQISLQPKQREAIKASDKYSVVFMGGAKGGGKSFTTRARELIRRLKYPGTNGLIIRKTYPELLSNHIRQFFKEYPVTRDWYNKAEKTIYFPNGSTTEFSYLKRTDDVYTYQGREYEDISIDEVTQHEWEVVKILRSSNRTTNPDIEPRIFLTGNPGGVGHQDIKRVFIDRNFREGEKPEDYFFVPAKVFDNRAILDNDPKYVDRLKALPEKLRKAYLEGDWNVFAGRAFEELDSIHVVKPFKLPDNTRFLSGYDYGYSHPFAWILIAITPDKKIYIVDHIKKHKKRPDEQAKMIINKLDQWNLDHVYINAGVDIWSNKGGRSTIYEQLRDGLGKRATLLRAKTDRKQGVAEIRNLVAWRNTTRSEPLLRFFENTLEVYDQIRGMQIDQKDTEDVIKVNADDDGNGGDDLYDSCFIGKTPILTTSGTRMIKDIKVGDEVLTQNGTGRVKHQWESGYKPVSILVTKQGRVIVATPDHKISSKSRFVRLDTLRYGDIIDTCQNQSPLMGLSLGDTQTQRENTLETTITQVETTKKEELRHFIERFGKAIMDLFQKVLLSTTKTVIHLITLLKTYSLWMVKNILVITCSSQRILRDLGNISRGLDHLQSSGISRKKVGNGIKNTISGCVTNYMLREHTPVSIAVKTSGQQRSMQSSVRISVGQRIVDKVVLMMWLGFAYIVASHLRLINTLRQHTVQDTVLLNIGEVSKSKVYDLEVEKEHNFYADGILVHNCRYGIMAYLNPNRKPREKIKPGTGAELKKLARLQRRVNQWT